MSEPELSPVDRLRNGGQPYLADQVEAALAAAYAEGRKDEREAVLTAPQPDPEPAFPIPGAAADHQFCGLHMRDYFAATVNTDGVALSALEALEGSLPAYADAKVKQDWYARAEAAFRYHRADAMLKARQ